MIVNRRRFWFVSLCFKINFDFRTVLGLQKTHSFYQRLFSVVTSPYAPLLFKFLKPCLFLMTLTGWVRHWESVPLLRAVGCLMLWRSWGCLGEDRKAEASLLSRVTTRLITAAADLDCLAEGLSLHCKSSPLISTLCYLEGNPYAQPHP